VRARREKESVSRIDQIVGLFCKRALYKRRYSAKETYNFIALQHTATHCSTHITRIQISTLRDREYVVRYTATHCNTNCNTLQHTATHCNTLQHAAAHCNALQHTASHCNTHITRIQISTLREREYVVRYTATHCNTLHRTATHPLHAFKYLL